MQRAKNKTLRNAVRIGSLPGKRVDLASLLSTYSRPIVPNTVTVGFKTL